MNRGRLKKEKVVAMSTTQPENKISLANYMVITHYPIRNREIQKLKDIMNSSFQDITF